MDDFLFKNINYTRNDRGNVVELSEGGVSVSYSYTAGGRLTGASYSNGMEMGMSYDSGGRLIDKVYSGNGSVISDFTYSYYEDTGNIKSKTISDLGEIDYSYDSMNRLTGATYSWRDGESFSYDYNGNRTGSNLYDMWNYDASNELLSYGSGGSPIANLTYNDNGSVISYTKNGNSFEFKYTPLERIEEVDLNGSLLSKYYYDPLGERVKKEIYSNGTLSNSIIYFYGQEGLLAEYDDSGNLIKKYIYNPDRPWGTDPLYQEDSTGNKYYYINNHLFTPQKMIDENLNTVWQGDWQSFGEVNELVNTVENNLRFPGKYYDSETGLYYNFHRYYEPNVGRYLREDPLGFYYTLLTSNSVETLSMYQNLFYYSNDNPVIYSDSLGLVPDWCKCEKKRKKHREECMIECSIEHPGAGIWCWIGASVAWSLLSKYYLGSPPTATACVVAGVATAVADMIICGPAPILCPFKCWLDEITLCQRPDRWWETRRNMPHCFGYRGANWF